ncbi:MAG: exodeoxyribonuclease VII large subunit, partial [Nannocystaceae bacterium]
TLEARFGDVWVQGEVSGLKIARTGHAYFNLVDDQSAISVAMWNSQVRRLRFTMEEGQELIVRGGLGIYARNGRFQLYAQYAEPAGAGARALEFERIKKRLQADGLCDDARKRDLPAWPRKIGLVTSAGGAALHDILEVGRSRCPMRYVLSHARVQGEGAPQELIEALRRVVMVADVDVVILGRGGGSADDLSAFNDEALARAVAACPVPVVAAIGHEVDISICDLVADVRAATPSQGAERVVPDLSAARAGLQHRQDRLERCMQRRTMEPRRQLEQASYRLERAGRALVADQRRRVDAAMERGLAGVVATVEARRARARTLERRLAATHPSRRIREDRTRLIALEARLVRVMREACQRRRLRMTSAMAKLDAMSPLGVLARGYALVTGPDGEVVRREGQVVAGARLGIRLAEGTLKATAGWHEDP